ncbi:Lrp/AsnC family transcriptional regulator [Nocardia otitidiscaviarum]|uniref:Lrp/AsnC family transcriptional regulator n=1 Tax=Nocardia otitidiscaviarum TaxID=1823 RepID=A0A378Y9P7_9NOCA|nr:MULTISPECIES: Lrp/AsnC family transcriptional regulator [Nocardia]MBF6137873.1 Lrp/AsnC family transcriptional regulator [Nocardia otitidiscaviarum]MBF6183107.1 Lrp/AsnC family transcriptional regulator [Nocardia otitidiscaviarum]MBF6240055.1 Lrp/AsnC family transcriptional regulator [Nocardia otitidiscaviarum]MBF6488769.1 Lrp/AsnC family transcriptional regulator [Nocardia otitidiscaviarum]MCP9622716.1 Lrp/AsnC family transcriptional regulator [Nocardia otitidiscaviarum]
MARTPAKLDELDLAILTAMHEHQKAGILELSRRTRVARATVQSRIARMEEAGVIASYDPQIDVSAAGFDVEAFVTLEIAQGALEAVAADLAAIPGVLEAYATTGSSDVLCRIGADSHAGLQTVLLSIDRTTSVVRSHSVIVLSTVVPRRTLPLLRTLTPTATSKAPAYRNAH